jgi:hypothetical protein
METSIEIEPKRKRGRPRREPSERIRHSRSGRPTLEYISYEEARAWVKKFRLKSQEDWKKFKNKRDKKTGMRLRPTNVPAYPELAYSGKGWKGYTDFLGLPTVFPYEKAKTEARKLGLKSAKEWMKWWDKYRPPTVGRRPDQYYEEWENWNEFLGNNNVPLHLKKWNRAPFEEARKYVHTLKLKSRQEYIDWHLAQRPSFLPLHPSLVYKKTGWTNWTEWLGTRSLSARLESKKTNTAIWFLVQYPQMPTNVFEIGIEHIGKQALLERQKGLGFKIIRVYKYEPETKVQTETLLNQFTSPYWEGQRQRLISNLPQLLFDLDQLLLKV